LAKQTYKNIEWVLIDYAYESRAKTLYDLSNKTGLKIIHKPNVRDNDLIFRDITRNRNKALRLATGDAVIFLDDYAVVYPDFVEKHVEILQDNCLSAGYMWRHEHYITPEEEQRLAIGDISSYPINDFVRDFDLKPDGRDARNGQLYKMHGTYTGNLGIPRAVFEQLNGFDPRMEGAMEDSDFGLRSAKSFFTSFFNPRAIAVNLYTGNKPYTFSFDHNHDLEPFIAGPANGFSGNITSEGNEVLKIEFKEGYRVGRCKICGARGIVDSNELMAHKQSIDEVSVPLGLPGGFR
jgi:hypothetical protein